MTPFGIKMRQLRAERNLTQQQQADYLGVSVAYVSSLERGIRGRPSSLMVDQICVWLGLIWDDAENLKLLASLSHPKPTIDARNTSPNAIYLANMVAQNIGRLAPSDCDALIAEMTKRLS